MALTRTIDVQDFMNAVGRSGSVLGSMFGGAILASGLGLPVAFAIVGIPVIIAGLSMFLKGKLAPQPVHHAVTAQPPAVAGAVEVAA
jgi:AAHS family 4-hydroxybenzoate transporter-like MFS transporter